jgi:hypothetical protein
MNHREFLLTWGISEAGNVVEVEAMEVFLAEDGHRQPAYIMPPNPSGASSRNGFASTTAGRSSVTFAMEQLPTAVSST